MLNKRPKTTKYSKYQKGRVSYNLPLRTKKYEESKDDLKYALIALEPCRLTASNIAASELAIKRELNIRLKSSNLAIWEKDGKKRNIKGEYLLHVFPHIPVTKKPAEVRMGKGKGSIDYWMTRVKIGKPILEIRFKKGKIKAWNKESELQIKSLEKRCFNIAFSTLNIVSSKLGIKTKIIEKST